MVSKTDVASGNVEYRDHDAGLNIKSSVITTVGYGNLCRGGTGVPPVNHAQDARATFKLF